MQLAKSLHGASTFVALPHLPHCKGPMLFLRDNYLPKNPKDPLRDEQLINVEKGVMTLLGIVFKPHHFAVVKVHLKNQKVSI